ncbi:phage tail protein [Tritonibacter scottomollicae]|uniref:Phage tail protein n=1 Tax=Tritonibacter scottomollicae TaxID=483013 RepID=A0ABZ0HDH8_TRISK|nr:phage tail protein [Tritonibacter scottomollicae]WOI32888.1 phage tail protein [Tritonibacter scottomollicae]
MSNILIVLAVACVFVLTPDPAAAGPLAAAITAIQTFAASSAVAAFVVRIGVSLALSALSTALQGKPKAQRAPGIRTDTTTTGGVNPQTFILGRTATAGNMVCPPYSTPNSGDVPNRYLHYVVDVSDLPGVEMSRVMVAGEYVADLEPAPGLNTWRGMLRDGAHHFYVNWHNGSQTAADPIMMAEYAGHPERPWSEDMVGAGVSYAVLTFLYNRALFNQLPAVRFEVLGIPLYDPRLDTSVGGSGAHRWADPSTWEFTENPVVMIYNILRGITLPDGSIWGGRVQREDLPLSNWFAAMNECDAPVQTAEGQSVAQYRAGLEVSTDDQPADVIDQLKNAASAELVEFGGVYKVRVGPPALPVYFFTDEDIVADRSQTLTPFPGLDGVHNAIHASYPDPSALWEVRDAPPRYNAEWESEDGGRQLVAQVDLPAVNSGNQAQRLMQAWIEDERRFRRHGLTLPPDAMTLEPLDTCSWTSAREGYTSKIFEVGDLTDDLVTCLQTMALRERDAADFVWNPSDEVVTLTPSPIVVVPDLRTVPGFGLLAHVLVDGASTARRAALRMTWNPSQIASDDILEWRLQLADGTPVASGAETDLVSGELILSGGILPSTDYRARARIRAMQGGSWTDWVEATTPAVYLGAGDMPSIAEIIDDAQAAADAAGQGAAQALTDAQNATDAANIANQAAQDASDEAGAAAAAALANAGDIQNIETDVTRLSSVLHRDMRWDFVEGTTGWTGHPGGGISPPLIDSSHIKQSDGRWVFERSGFQQLSHAALLPFVAGHTYEAEAEVRVTIDSTITGGTAERFVLDGVYLAANGGYLGAFSLSDVDGWTRAVNPLRAEDGWVKLRAKAIPPAPDPNTAFIRIRLLSLYGGTGAHGDGTWQVSYFRAEDTTEADEIRANLSQNYLTAVQTGEAIAASETALQASIDGVSSDLSQNYYTRAQADSAVTVSETTLRAEIDTTRAMTMVPDFADRGKFWKSAPDGSPANEAAIPYWTFNSLAGPGYRYARLDASEIDGTKQVHLWSRGAFTPELGRRYRVSVGCYVQGTVTGNPNILQLFIRRMDRNFAYAGSNAMATAVTPAPSGVWGEYTAEVTCTNEKTAQYWRPGILIRGERASLSPGFIGISYIKIEDITDADELSGAIDEIKTLDINALTGTALANMLTELNTDTNGSSATVTSLLQTQADVDGFSSAFAGVTAETNGGRIAGFRANSWSDPSGAGGSVLELLGDVIAEGSMATNRLTVGLGKNLLGNTDFVDGVAGWDFGTGTGSGYTDSSIQTRPAGQSYAGEFYPTLMVWQDSGATDGYRDIVYHPRYGNGVSAANGVAVLAGEWVEVSAYVSAHRCSAELRIQFTDAAGALVSYSGALESNNGFSGSAINPELWPRLWGKAQVPVGAAYATIHLRKKATNPGHSNSYIFVHKPQLAQTTESATLPTPYSPQGSTLINGNRIATGAVTAEKVNVNELSAITANIGHFKSASSGERVEIEDDRIRVFDSSGVARVVIGRLT